ncbi:MAG: GNAT family N-acetyltransferase [Blastocatellia bacterium]
MFESKSFKNRLRIGLAAEQDRDTIYHLRHAVFASELAQHAENAEGRLTDGLDEFNVYITAWLAEEIAGFISITPPGASYSIDKYLSRKELPFPIDDGLYELRLLAVIPPHRGSRILPALIYAAFRWIESRRGTRIVAIGRRQILDIYLKVGMKALGREIKSGAVSFELITATIEEVNQQLARYNQLLAKLERSLDWQMDIPFSGESEKNNAAGGKLRRH